MNKVKKNIVLVDFTEEEIRRINVPPIGKITYLDNLRQLKNQQGYLLIINDKENKNIVEYDKKYRKKFNNFVNIWIYNNKARTYFKNKFSNIELMDEYIFNGNDLAIWEMWDEYKENLKNKKYEYTEKVNKKIDEMYKYLLNYETIRTIEIANDLNMEKRTVQIYMNLINERYHNIGYDFSNNIWYIIK